MKTRIPLPPLSEQMAICDANYMRLLKLLPQLEPGYERDIRIPGRDAAHEMCFTLSVTEGFKYTSTVMVRQRRPDTRLPWYLRPEMQVRLYHDANAAEVISYQNHRYFHRASLFPADCLYQPGEKTLLNQFLADWLALCLSRGMSAPLAPASCQP